MFDVDDAYAVETPTDCARLYGEWAETYDAEFVEPEGYVVYLRVAEVLLQQRSLINGAVLDAGCGTGLVGVSLRAGGIEVIDGIVIAPQMLAEAGLDIPDNQYAGLVSAGTFTHGHLGPDSLDELWRVAASGAVCAIGVRSTHYESASFGDKLAADVAKGTITKPNLVEINMYSADTKNLEHANDTAIVVVCQIT